MSVERFFTLPLHHLVGFSGVCSDFQRRWGADCEEEGRNIKNGRILNKALHFLQEKKKRQKYISQMWQTD